MKRYLSIMLIGLLCGFVFNQYAFGCSTNVQCFVKYKCQRVPGNSRFACTSEEDYNLLQVKSIPNSAVCSSSIGPIPTGLCVPWHCGDRVYKSLTTGSIAYKNTSQKFWNQECATENEQNYDGTYFTYSNIKYPVYKGDSGASDAGMAFVARGYYGYIGSKSAQKK